MNIESAKINMSQETSTQKTSQTTPENDGKFAEELKTLKKPSEEKDSEKASEGKNIKNTNEEKPVEKISDEKNVKDSTEKQNNQNLIKSQNAETLIKSDSNHEISSKNVQKNIMPENEEFGNALDKLNFIVKELNQSEEIQPVAIKDKIKITDNKEEGDVLINNDFNIQENKDLLPQMNPNMNFGGDGQPFSSFMNNASDEQQSKDVLKSTAKDIAEETAILSTMAENIAIANKAKIEEPSEKTVNKNDGIKKIDTQTGIVQETIVKYDNIIMNEADVEVFANLVQKGEIDLNNMAPEALKKSVHVSKTLADMLAKAMEDNKPVRIDFDNNISVIIKISRDGKLTADFLPSSQVAEAYLKENLPLLKQRFDEQNIKYDELNQRERRNREQDDNRKKGRENE